MDTGRKWYADCYRRNLVDMHIEDWNDEFLSRFSAEEYFENLVKGKIQAPMIYFHSHVGHCYFPTRVGHMHGALKNDPNLIRDHVIKCKRAGMHPVGYYSLIYNTYEEDRHPDWKLMSDDSHVSTKKRGGRYGLVCPNNPDYREFLKAQIREMNDFFRDEFGELLVDGMFYDMTFWPALCRCEHCLKMYTEATGRPASDFPYDYDVTRPETEELQELREQWIGEFATFVTSYTKEIMGDGTVEHNCASAIADSSFNGVTEAVSDQCDYEAGDLYGDLYNHSFAAKYYYSATKNQPFEYMTCRAEPNLNTHTATKSEAHLSTEVMLTAAHHGASFIIDAIDPRGTMDGRVYDRIGRVFDRQIPYEKYFRGKLSADVGVWYSLSGRYSRHKLGYNSKTCAVALVRSLVAGNISASVLPNNTGDISGYKAVFVPCACRIPEYQVEKLVDYVKNGGALYISGAEQPDLLEKLLGAGIAEEYTKDTFVYFRPAAVSGDLFGEFTPDFPLLTSGRLPVVSIDGDADVLATYEYPYTRPDEPRFASIHSNPPGIPTDIPAVVLKKYGKGKVLWSAYPIETDNRYLTNVVMNNIFSLLIPESERSILSTAPRQVELVTFRNGNEVLISAVDLLCTEEEIPVSPFEVRVRTEAVPDSVTKLASNSTTDADIPFRYENGYVVFRTDSLVRFDMYRIV